MQNFFIGIDGGATKSVGRLEDVEGNLLATTVSGPANVRLSVSDAVQSIMHIIHQLLAQRSLSLEHSQSVYHCGMGLAGCEVASARIDFIKRMPSFETLHVVSDAHTACLGAHNGRDGAIIIIGTGMVGYQIERQNTFKIAGWGFPHDDQGSGAWLGLQAINHALKSHDGRHPVSLLSAKLMLYFKEDPEQLILYANLATPADFGKIAPLVIEAEREGCMLAKTLLQQAASYVDEVAFSLMARSKVSSPIALVGGMAPYLQPYLHEAVQLRLVPCEQPPEVGALIALRQIHTGKLCQPS